MARRDFVFPETLVSDLYMVGPTYAKRLTKLGISNLGEFIYHFPFRYDDYSMVSSIGLVQPGEVVTLKGQVLSIKNIVTKFGKRVQKAVVVDDSGEIEATWFNQPFLTRTLKKGSMVYLSGKVDLFGGNRVLSSPDYEVEKVGQKPIHTGRIVPVYPGTYGVSSKWLRSRIYSFLNNFIDQFKEFLPDEIIREYGLVDLKTGIKNLHFPEDKELAEKARERLSFDELFLIWLGTIKRKRLGEKVVGEKFMVDGFKKEIKEFERQLPFELTSSQKKVIREIFKDLEKDKVMNRILEGDVGSGKTIVAVVTMYLAYLNGKKSILMCPTEILANQHYKTVKDFFEKVGLKVALRTSAVKTPGGQGKNADIAIGTHALLSLNLDFNKIGLVVVDEQHRFGVKQRAKIKEKGINPHFLAMSATPIPRTIALTLYGDLNLSVIDEMPKGRKEVKTWFVPAAKRQEGYKWIKDKIRKEKDQVFIVCPLIEESGYENMKSVKAAKVEYERLKREVFGGFKIGLLHGRVKSKEKEKVINDFADKKIDVLVATPVVEVGIDIPGATIMVIEGAERFGLATLHQLRGRVGRRGKESYCLLFSDEFSSRSIKRLRSLEECHLGMELAEIDLKLRGPGEIFGVRQHGIPDLRVGSFSDREMIKKTKEAAEKVLDKDIELKDFPYLKERLEKYIIKGISLD